MTTPSTNTPLPLTRQMKKGELEAYLWGAATRLRGVIDAGDYKQFIFPFLFFKRLSDVYDEEFAAALKDSGGDQTYAAFAENHRFLIPEGAHWRDVREATANLGIALQGAMRAIESANAETLLGIFGDAQWTNKERLSDPTLRDLIEHFSTLTLSVANIPEDELGVAYEFLIKKFADDSGHTAAEFYTNRTLVHLMTRMLQPQEGESVYDPTCGSGGMLLSCAVEVKRQGGEWRTLRLYGQERNLLTSAIARMNLLLHGFEEFKVVRGDTLAEPKLLDGDRLRQFDVCLANPPYSIKAWNRAKWASDPYGRNQYGTPPQGRADYAFWQHILASLKPETGRCAILFPHGVLFRDEERQMREGIVKTDVIECVLGLGPNLFYNSPMEACVIVCRTRKAPERRGKILFINAVNEVMRERAQSFLTDAHQEKIVAAYRAFSNQEGFAHVAEIADIERNGWSLNMPLYVRSTDANGNGAGQDALPLEEVLDDWLSESVSLRASLDELLTVFGDGDIRVLTDQGLVSEIAPLGLDRSRWRKVSLGQIAKVVQEVERDPVAAGFDRFVKAEHLDPDSPRVVRWGSMQRETLPPTFYKVFRAGQILYPTRNPHLRRGAVADFDGICGEKTLTIVPSTDDVDSRFLPLIFQTEALISHSSSRSVGSTNRHVRWRDVADFTFALPPLDEQRRIAEVLWAADNDLKCREQMAQSVDLLITSTVQDFLDVCDRKVKEGHSGYQCLRAEAVFDAQPRNGLSPSTAADAVERYSLSIGCVQNGRVMVEGHKKIAKVDPAQASRFPVCKDDILIVRGNGNKNLVGLAGRVPHDLADFVYPDLLIRVTFDPSIIRIPFAVLQWNHKRAHDRLLTRAKSSNGIWKVNGQDIRALEMLVPPIQEQDQFLDRVSGLGRGCEAAVAACHQSRALRQKLTGHLL